MWLGLESIENYGLTNIIYEKGTYRYLNILSDEYAAYKNRGLEWANDSDHINNLSMCHREYEKF